MDLGPDRALPPAPHRIGRVRFELEGSDAVALAGLRDRIADGADGWVARALSAALDGVDLPGRTLTLGRIEIDLGVIGPEGRLTPQTLEAAVRRAVAARLGAATGSAAAAPASVREARDAPPASEEDALAAALAAFLSSGRLPWWSPAADVAALEAAILMLGPDPLRVLAALVAPTLRRPNAARRLSIQVAPAAARRLAAALPKARRAGLAPAGDGQAEAPAPGTAAFEAAVRRAAGMTPPVPPDARPSRRRGDPALAPASPALRRDRAGSADDLHAALDAPDEDPAAAQAEGPASEGALAVTDAGLVVAGPFLPELYRRLGLLAGAGFPDDAARERAVHLAARVAWGAGARAEPDLVVAKLLCGWPLAAPVARDPKIGVAEAAECEALLGAIIGHWTALGAASPEAVRETFLIRPGLLTVGETGWRLRVERRTLDVLLDRAPWSVRVQKAAWMPRPLLVDW